jgi:hypothetical protein
MTRLTLAALVVLAGCAVACKKFCTGAKVLGTAAIAIAAMTGCAQSPSQWTGGPRPVATPMGVTSLATMEWVDCELQARAQGRDIVGECMREKGFREAR